MASQAETNKAAVKDLLKKAFNEKNVQAAAAYLIDRYIQHNLLADYEQQTAYSPSGLE